MKQGEQNYHSDPLLCYIYKTKDCSKMKAQSCYGLNIKYHNKTIFASTSNCKMISGMNKLKRLMKGSLNHVS